MLCTSLSIPFGINKLAQNDAIAATEAICRPLTTFSVLSNKILFVSLGEPIHTSQHSLFCVWSFRQLDLCERNIKKSSKSFIIRENPALNLTVTDTKKTAMLLLR